MSKIETAHAFDREKGNICIQCGLCCDGSIFSCAKIDPHDDLTLLKQMGVQSVMDGDAPIFLLPCGGQEGKLCGLYNDARRFKVCKKFKCRLLKRYTSGEISYGEAVHIIEEAGRHRQGVKVFAEIIDAESAMSGKPIRTFIIDLARSGKIDDPHFRKIFAKQILDVLIFRDLLRGNFFNNEQQAY